MLPHLQKGTSHRDSMFTLWNRPKLKENHFLYLKTSFVTQSYPLCISLVFKPDKKVLMFNFSRRLFEKRTAATHWWMDCAKFIETLIFEFLWRELSEHINFYPPSFCGFWNTTYYYITVKCVAKQWNFVILSVIPLLLKGVQAKISNFPVSWHILLK